MTESQAHLLVVWTAIVSIAILIMAIALAAIAFAVVKLFKQITELTAEAKGKVYPILASVQKISEKAEVITAHAQDISAHAKDIVADSTPKVKHITQNIMETSDVYRAKVADIDSLLTDTTGKVKRQSDRVDHIVTDVLTKSTELAANVQHAIYAPVRQVSGLIGGAKAGIESLIHSFTAPAKPKTPKPVAFEGESVYTGYEDEYHA